MAGTAVLGRLTWRAARLLDVRQETATARTLVLDVPGWLGHRPGQHVDVRLTAEDGYSTQRSYSIASAEAGTRVELGIQILDDGEVSPYLGEVSQVGDVLELRGPVGGYFVWDFANPAPVLLIGGGSGVVPLIAMVRTWVSRAASAPMSLIVSTRSPETLMYGAELAKLQASQSDLSIDIRYTRSGPPGYTGEVGRLGTRALGDLTADSDDSADVFVCGPTGFVESVIETLVAAGHSPSHIKAERFGGSG
jgi:ferredoxin-NADP reductase